MRYVTFSHLDGEDRLGVLGDGCIVDAHAVAAPVWPGICPASLQQLIDAGPDAWQRMAGLLSDRSAAVRASMRPVATIRLHAPIRRPRRNIFCVGRNYGAVAGTARPLFFTKATTSVTGPTDVITWDARLTEQVDWEVELGVVIGRGGKNLSADEADRHVFGYTVVNDLSARDLQSAHGQFFKGKSLDGFCPMGPCVVTPDELGNLRAKRISLRINGVTKQNACIGDMTLSPAELLESLSAGMSLEPGDILSTGSPAGSGQTLEPKEWLRNGDEIEAEIEGIGVLQNQVTVGL